MRQSAAVALVLLAAVGCHRTLVMPPATAPKPAPVAAKPKPPITPSTPPASRPAPWAVSEPTVPGDRVPSVRDAREYALARRLMVPVDGLSPADVRDSFLAGRVGHIHRAVDLFAPTGRPVLAPDDGRIVRLGEGAIGGKYVYLEDRGGRLVFYFAHLDRVEADLHVGDIVARGAVLGAVGTTGNAAGLSPHLHFQILIASPTTLRGGGVAVNPVGLLLESGEPTTPLWRRMLPGR